MHINTNVVNEWYRKWESGVVKMITAEGQMFDLAKDWANQPDALAMPFSFFKNLVSVYGLARWLGDGPSWSDGRGVEVATEAMQSRDGVEYVCKWCGIPISLNFRNREEFEDDEAAATLMRSLGAAGAVGGVIDYGDQKLIILEYQNDDKDTEAWILVAAPAKYIDASA